MMGDRTVLQGFLFYSVSLDRHVQMDHLLRSIERSIAPSTCPHAVGRQSASE